MQETVYNRIAQTSGLKIGIIDADLVDHGTRHPNLALMKISGYCKEHSHSVELLLGYDALDRYDYVFISCVFTFTNLDKDILALPNVIAGGTGIYPDGGEGLPYEVEHHMPDYSLYDSWAKEKLAKGCSRGCVSDYLDYSVGFLTRGCFRKCEFCVNKKYDRAFLHSPLEEFYDESRPYIYLWDDNFLSYAGWEPLLDDLIATKKPFQFRQGLDIRLMTKEKAKKLSRVRYHGDFIFAFDHIEDRELIEKKLKVWRSYTERGTRLYVLCAFDSQDEKDIESMFTRISVLMKYGCLPYIMRFEDYKKSEWRSLYVNVARWCNQPQFFKKKSFREFCLANQAYHKTEGTLCSAYAAMVSFEARYPEIAEKFFDLKFEDENMYFRYGRRFVNAPSAEEETIQHRNWERFGKGGMSRSEILGAYFSKKLDIAWLASLPGGGGAQSAYRELFETILTASFDEILCSIRAEEDLEQISQSNIPQFSSVEDAANVPAVLLNINEPLDYDSLGIYLVGSKGKKAGANKKYGENHGKLATLLDLADLKRKDGFVFVPTPFSGLFAELDSDAKNLMLAKLSLRIPIVQTMLVDACANEFTSIDDYLKVLADSTRIRRRSNVRAVISLIGDHCSEDDVETLGAINRVVRS